MNDALIANWNARVQHDDMVYVLGDMFFCDVSAARGIMHRLHCRHASDIDQLFAVHDIINQMVATPTGVQSDRRFTRMTAINVLQCSFDFRTFGSQVVGSHYFWSAKDDLWRTLCKPTHG